MLNNYPIFSIYIGNSKWDIFNMKTPAQLAFIEILDRLINDAPMTQVDLASKLDYDNPNLITMIKQGRTRLPLGKVAPLARALGQDPRMMIREWLRAYEPEALDEIEAVFFAPLTADELSWVRELRRAYGRVPKFELLSRASEDEC
jgi:transcriptional regulator with XRE-family HTH domain